MQNGHFLQDERWNNNNDEDDDDDDISTCVQCVWMRQEREKEREQWQQSRLENMWHLTHEEANEPTK